MTFFKSTLYLLIHLLTTSAYGQSTKCLEVTCINPINVISVSDFSYNHYFIVRSISDTITIKRVQTSGVQMAHFRERELLPGESDTITIHSPLQGRIGKWNKSIAIITNKCTEWITTKFTVIPATDPIPYAVFAPHDNLRFDTIYPNMIWYGIRVKDYPRYEIDTTTIDGRLIKCKYWNTEPTLKMGHHHLYEIKKISPVFTKSLDSHYTVAFPYKYLYHFVIGLSKPLLTPDISYYFEDDFFIPKDSILNLNCRVEFYRKDTSIVLSTSSKEDLIKDTYKIFYQKINNDDSDPIKPFQSCEIMDREAINSPSNPAIYPKIFFVGKLDADDLPDFILRYKVEYSHEYSYQLILSSQLQKFKDTQSFIYSTSPLEEKY